MGVPGSSTTVLLIAGGTGVDAGEPGVRLDDVETLEQPANTMSEHTGATCRREAASMLR